LQPNITGAIHGLTGRFESVLNRVDLDLIPAHQAFCRRLLHPLTLCSPFMHRTFQKPLGYAGDYKMVDMMFRDPFEGGSLFAKMLNAYALQLPPIVGHRNRIRYLGEKLAAESARGLIDNRGTRVLSIGCGSAQEVQRFIMENNLANEAHFTLVDFDKETLEHTARVLNDLKDRYQRRTQIHTIKKSVFQIVKDYERNRMYPQSEQYDLIYCAGLFDYLSDQVCRQLVEIFYAMLLPNGLLIVTNVDDHPARNQMECFLDWHLVYRNTDKIRGLIPIKADPQNILVKRDASGVNVFLEIRKPKSEQPPTTKN
jgi:extracellular factor (EF) 3-hydroxypalmitic acid methyl ester biosynthesis protein